MAERPFGKHGLHGRQINGGFPRTGHPVQQHRQKFVLVSRRCDLLQSGLLRGREQKLQLARLHPRHVKARRLFDEFDNPTTYQSLKRASRDIQFAQLFHRAALPVLVAQVRNDGLLVGVQLTLDRLQHRNLHRPARIAYIAEVFADNPLLPQQRLQHRARGSRGRAERSLADHFSIRQPIEDGILLHLVLGLFLRASRRAYR